MKTPKDAYRGNADKLPDGDIFCKGFIHAGYRTTAMLIGAFMELSNKQALWYRKAKKRC